jgi:1-acyl-sn-glycerol-3-phosphate acyltransferase
MIAHLERRPMPIRSFLYSIAFFSVTAVMAILGAPFALGGHRGVMIVVKAWTSTLVGLHRLITGTRHEYRHLERIPPGGCIVASKHQSTFETLALVPLLSDPAFILKRELTWIPVFGWWLKLAGNIAIDRGSPTVALRKVIEGTRAAVGAGRQVIIFPEGTRAEAGAKPDYKQGIAQIYKSLDVPVLPVAHNAGTVWPRKARVHRRGTIVVEFLEPIPPGLKPRDMFQRLEADIEAACDRLLVEAAARGDDLPEMARARVAELSRGAPAP